MIAGYRRGPRVAVFDLDGTLFDSLPTVLRAIRYALEPFDSHPLTMEIFPRLGGPPERFFPTLLRNPEDTAAALERLSTFIAEHGWNASPFVGVPELLATLRRAGVHTAVWTGRDRISTLELVNRHSLGPLLDAVVCGDDFPTHKPHPEGMRVLLARFEAHAADAIFAGDSDVDALSGAASGVRTILIQTGRTLPDDIASKVWRIVSRPDEAYGLVLAWASDGA